MEDQLKILVIDTTGGRHEINIEPGTNLRLALIENGLSPYLGASKKFNCKGVGICGTCKVLVAENQTLWERRSCQIQCFQEMEIRLK